MEAIADFCRSQDAALLMDDRTGNDLLMDNVFAFVDRTESSIGQQPLYRRLRSAAAKNSLEAFDAVLQRVSDDATFRERAQIALVRLSDSSGYYLHRLTGKDALHQQPWRAFFPLWTLALLVTLAMGFVWHSLIVFAGVGDSDQLHHSPGYRFGARDRSSWLAKYRTFTSISNAKLRYS